MSEGPSSKQSFSVLQLFLAVTFVGITIGGNIPLWNLWRPIESHKLFIFIGMFLPLLTPCAFAGYAAGRRALTPGITISYAISQAVAVALYYVFMKIHMAVW
ncbi:MAG: hypothetical protein AB7O59_11920 [Pirellulales bacterium]